tara:strand:- start:1075 stop:1533 length:459 start_codon:yes stop_codon:yes gene_type:complete
MENIKKIIKVLKVLESVLSVENNLGPEFKKEVETDQDLLKVVYSVVEDLHIVNNHQEEIERLIATFLINYELCNGDWNKFLTGELKLEKPKLKTFIATHDYTGVYHVTESTEVESYFESSVYWDMYDHGLDFEDDDMDLVDMYDNEYNVKEL